MNDNERKELEQASAGVLELAEFMEKASGPGCMNNYRIMWLRIIEDARKARDPVYERCTGCKTLKKDVKTLLNREYDHVSEQRLCTDCVNQ